MMRLGLITDVHNDIDHLRAVLDALRCEGFDRLITLGDTCDAFAPPEGSDEVAQLLTEEQTIGVWGNHDFVFHHDTPDFVRDSFGSPTFEFMAKTMPRFEIKECHFSHLESSVDPNDPAQLWRVVETELDLFLCAQDAFRSVTHRFQFTGHYHRWFAASPEGSLEWDGTSPLDLSSGQRFFVVISPVILGDGAIFDTEAGVLTPIRSV